ncbi:MAG: type III pantothenate kinase [Bacteroidetes bacterium]|nr:MAG: type III pantothenate kinase [Bacteroidota bacterium]
MNVVIDIGNSNVVVGVYCDGQLSHIWRIPTKTNVEVNHYKLEVVKLMFEANVDIYEIDYAVLSSVVPDLTRPFVDFLSDFLKTDVIVVGPEIYGHLELTLSKPNEIGSDLVANAYAAITRYKRDSIVIDFGTALTVLAVGNDWQLHGVSIAPGIKTALKSLNINTAKLPEVPLNLPESVLGLDTVHAIQSGVLIGYIGLVEKLVARYKSEWNPEAIVIATGGLNHVLDPLRKLFYEVHPNLTLDGLCAIGRKVIASRANG